MDSRGTIGNDIVPHLGRVVVPEAVAFPGYPSGVVADGLLFLSGLRGVTWAECPRNFDDLPKGKDFGRQGFWLADAAEEQVAIDGWNAHDALDRVLAAAGSTEHDLLRLRIWQRDKRSFPAYERVRAVRQPRPSSSSGHSADPRLGINGRSIGLDGIAVARDGALTRDVRTGDDRPAVERHNAVTQYGQYAFMAALTPVKQQPGFPTVLSFDDVPEAGRRFATGRSHTDSRDGPIAAQTWYVYDKVRSHLERIGGGLRDVVHCLVCLRDLRDLAMFHRVHHDLFGTEGPALTIIGTSEVGHRESRIYVEPTIYLGESASTAWSGRPPLSAPLSRSAGRLVFVSGALPITDEGGLIESISDLGAGDAPALRAIAIRGDEAFAAQSWQVWSNLKVALERSGSSLDRLVKITVFISDPKHWPLFEDVRACFIAAGLPAVEALVVPHPGPHAACLLQVDAVAALP